MAFPQCLWARERKQDNFLVSFYKDTNPSDQGPTLRTSFNFTSIKALCPNTVMLGLEAPIEESRGEQTSSPQQGHFKIEYPNGKYA